jgi:hypothetical protein
MTSATRPPSAASPWIEPGAAASKVDCDAVSDGNPATGTLPRRAPVAPFGRQLGDWFSLPHGNGTGADNGREPEPSAATTTSSR